MIRHEGIDGLIQLPTGTVLSVGNFDGLHLGHRSLLAHCRTLRGDAGIAVVTFEPHPMTVLRPDRVPPRLMPLSMKIEQLAALGVDHLVTLPPTPEVLGLTAEAFWAILRDQVRPAHLVEGTTFNFGKDRGGTIDRLREWSVGTAVQLHVVDAVSESLLDLHQTPVSSSTIRWLLSYGRVREAAMFLSCPYTLRGTVVKGFQRGRTIGVPTANLDCGSQLIPGDGVYVGRAVVDGQIVAAAVSIGSLPTFADGRFQVEAHLLDWAGDLYGQTIDLQLIDWVRDQWKFASVDELKLQIAVDLADVRKRYRFDPSRLLMPSGRSATDELVSPNAQ